jgi:NRPS condensation-like uncharacterized protein
VISDERAARTTDLDRYPRTPFGIVDELSCFYEGPGEPNNVHVEVWLPGHLDGMALRDAAAAALDAQPRTRARRVPAPPWRLRYAWEYPRRQDVDPVSCTTWEDEDDLARERASFLGAAPPLDTSPPLRLLLARGPGQDCVILNAHHAAFDGISCLQLLRSVARNYGGTHEKAQFAPPVIPGPSAPPVIPGPSAPPVIPGPSAPLPSPRASSGHQAAPPSGHLFPMAATRIAAQPDSGAARRREPGYGFHLMTLPRTPSAATRGSGPGATVNDMLIGAMILAIGRWNDSHGTRADRIRITMPLGGRQAGQDDTGMGNLSRLATVTANPPAPGSGYTELITEVARQTRYAKENAGPQVDSLCRALAAAWCPAALKHRALRLALRTLGPLVCDTSLISNLGYVADPPRFGPAVPTQMWFSTSAHMPRGLSLGAITIGGKLHLCFRYRRALFDETAAAQFAGEYAVAMSMLANAGLEG